MKSVQIRGNFWSEYRKIRSRNNSLLGHFSRSAVSPPQLKERMERISFLLRLSNLYICFRFVEKINLLYLINVVRSICVRNPYEQNMFMFVVAVV